MLEEALNDAPRPRPEDSVTAEEFAAKSGYSETQARKKLADIARAGKLKAVIYMTENHKRGVCYVAA